VKCQNKNIQSFNSDTFISSTSTDLTGNPIKTITLNTFTDKNVKIGGYIQDLNTTEQYFPFNVEKTIADYNSPLKLISINGQTLSNPTYKVATDGQGEIYNNNINNAIKLTTSSGYQKSKTYTMEFTYQTSDNKIQYTNYIKGKLNTGNFHLQNNSPDTAFIPQINEIIDPVKYSSDNTNPYKVLPDLHITQTDGSQVMYPLIPNKFSFITPDGLATGTNGVSVQNTNGIKGAVMKTNGCFYAGNVCDILWYNTPTTETPSYDLVFDNNFQKVILPVKIKYFAVPDFYTEKGNVGFTCMYMYYGQHDKGK
jgi:hypothetical protein